MLRRLWLLFAQATTVGLAALFIVATLRPEWLRGAPPVVSTPVSGNVSIQQVAIADPANRAAGTTSYADAARRAMGAVVSVYTTKEVRRDQSDDSFTERPFGARRRPNERSFNLGSGVIATADGYVLTNNHVVEAAEQIAVKLPDGREVDAQLVGADPESDLAVLKVSLANLPAITFGRSEALRVGDVVLAIGNPFDVGQTVTMGIVSALGRNDLRINPYENFIQTDAAINQGNSGGALIDASGTLVGINSAIFSRTGDSVGIGFAIPTSIVTQVMDQLIKTGKVTRGYFGVEPDDVPPPDHREGMSKLRRRLPWAIWTFILIAFSMGWLGWDWLRADTYDQTVIAQSLAMAIIFLSFVVVTGMSGQVSLMQASFERSMAHIAAAFGADRLCRQQEIHVRR